VDGDNGANFHWLAHSDGFKLPKVIEPSSVSLEENEKSLKKIYFFFTD
jgi:hypothetical protein